VRGVCSPGIAQRRGIAGAGVTAYRRRLAGSVRPATNRIQSNHSVAAKSLSMLAVAGVRNRVVAAAGNSQEMCVAAGRQRAVQ